MHRTAIGTPTPKASPKREAEETPVSPALPGKKRFKKRTYIAPDWCRILDVGVPDNGVDEVDQTG
jgi:hypothetical protein